MVFSIICVGLVGIYDFVLLSNEGESVPGFVTGFSIVVVDWSIDVVVDGIYSTVVVPVRRNDVVVTKRSVVVDGACVVGDADTVLVGGCGGGTVDVVV